MGASVSDCGGGRLARVGRGDHGGLGGEGRPGHGGGSSDPDAETLLDLRADSRLDRARRSGIECRASVLSPMGRAR